MATVLQRFEHLGIAHNNKILMIAGCHVARKFPDTLDLQRTGRSRKRIKQKEGEEEFEVWDYPAWWIKEMDREIINFLEHYLEKQIATGNE